MLIEIAVFNLESAIAAAEAGAHRIELCTAPAEGGLTPSAATLRLARKYVKIPIHVMIRPREGDFCYSSREFESMLLDIAAAKMAGMEGVVAGILNPDGTVDDKRMAMLVDAAAPMNVTFHRAFDMVRDQDEALESIIYAGCARILTSGGQQTAILGIEKLSSLVQKASNRISIMPGSGINLSNIKHIAELTKVSEMHLSARANIPGKMAYRQNQVGMSGNGITSDYDLMMPDKQVVQATLNMFV